MASDYESIRKREEKAISRIINIVGFFILGLFLFFNAVYTLSETEQAVVTTFGVPTVNTGKGMQFKVPFIQKVKKVDTTIKGFELGYRTDEIVSLIQV